MGRKHSAFERRVARALKGWKDPHDQRPYPELDTVQVLKIKGDGEISLTVKPLRPHCPCCLLDLEALRRHLSSIKGASFVHIEVVDVPGAPRWTRAINR
ncbi:iron-sulfur cluster assembly protein [Candidatus Poseidonia sp.]|nr:iron-sulfur cluster assembly protein [Poseidonia sp.]